VIQQPPPEIGLRRLSSSWFLRYDDMPLVVDRLTESISVTTSVDLFACPTRRPVHLIASDPVMRLAIEVPVSDRRIEGDRFTIVRERPVSSCERRHYFAGAAATTAMYRRRVWNRDVENAIGEFFRNELHELGHQRELTRHTRSSLIRWLPAIWYRLWCSRSWSR